MVTPLTSSPEPEKSEPQQIELPDEVSVVKVVRRNGVPYALRATTPSGDSPGQWRLEDLDELQLLAGVNTARTQASKAAADMSARLLIAGGTAAETTQRRIATTFTGYMWMLGTMFSVGIIAFLCAVVRGFTANSATDATTTAIFGGLSAASFVTVFLSRPINAMGTAGPNNAWLLAIINTYWSKLAYFQDSATVIDDLNKAQQSLNNDFITYFAHTGQAPQAEDNDAGGDTPQQPTSGQGTDTKTEGE